MDAEESQEQASHFSTALLVSHSLLRTDFRKEAGGGLFAPSSRLILDEKMLRLFEDVSMRTVVQRVKSARVEVDGQVTGAIEQGLLVLIGIARWDSESDAEYLVDKLANLRIFHDENGKMNRNVREAGGALLLVSQFTLYGDCSRGRRPSFDDAAPAAQARLLYEYFVARARQTAIPVETGVFQAMMSVHLENDGPVTLICESPARA